MHTTTTAPPGDTHTRAAAPPSTTESELRGPRTTTAAADRKRTAHDGPNAEARR